MDAIDAQPSDNIPPPSLAKGVIGRLLLYFIPSLIGTGIGAAAGYALQMGMQPLDFLRNEVLFTGWAATAISAAIGTCLIPAWSSNSIQERIKIGVYLGAFFFFGMVVFGLVMGFCLMILIGDPA